MFIVQLSNVCSPKIQTFQTAKKKHKKPKIFKSQKNLQEARKSTAVSELPRTTNALSSPESPTYNSLWKLLPSQHR